MNTAILVDDGHCDEELNIAFVVGIEIKPVLGDDFPAILRQLKKRRVFNCTSHSADRFKILAFNDFDGRSATLDQVREIFRRSKIVLCDLSEVSAHNRE